MEIRNIDKVTEQEYIHGMNDDDQKDQMINQIDLNDWLDFINYSDNYTMYGYDE
jgi:hypothetical protein